MVRREPSLRQNRVDFDTSTLPYSVLRYPRPDARIDAAAHALIPFAPRTGLALGLLRLSMLVSFGVVGAIAPILRPEVAIRSALICGCVLFGLVYGVGWLLVS
jgi:hypothetical protein